VHVLRGEVAMICTVRRLLRPNTPPIPKSWSGENNNENLGPKPLTSKQKAVLRKKREKEAKEKVDRELQEQLEREETAMWTIHE